MTRSEAIAAAEKQADTVVREAIKGVTGLIDEAIDLRRAKPMRFALFHRYMKEWRKSQGKAGMAGYHLFWEMRYTAKARALNAELAGFCGIRLPAAP